MKKSVFILGIILLVMGINSCKKDDPITPPTKQELLLKKLMSNNDSVWKLYDGWHYSTRMDLETKQIDTANKWVKVVKENDIRWNCLLNNDKYYFQTENILKQQEVDVLVYCYESGNRPCEEKKCDTKIVQHSYKIGNLDTVEVDGKSFKMDYYIDTTELENGGGWTSTKYCFRMINDILYYIIETRHCSYYRREDKTIDTTSCGGLWYNDYRYKLVADKELVTKAK